MRRKTCWAERGEVKTMGKENRRGGERKDESFK